jgi:hypothetical protein
VTEASQPHDGSLVSIDDVDIVRATPWLVHCRISGRPVDIPRGRIDSYDSLAPGERVMLRLPLWFARAIGVGASAGTATSVDRLGTSEPHATRRQGSGTAALRDSRLDAELLIRSSSHHTDRRCALRRVGDLIDLVSRFRDGLANAVEKMNGFRDELGSRLILPSRRRAPRRALTVERRLSANRSDRRQKLAWLDWLR